MSEDKTRTLINRYIAAWLRADLDAVMDCVTDDVEFCTLGRSRPMWQTTTYRGREAVAAAFGDRVGDDPGLTLSEVIVCGDYVIGPWARIDADGTHARGIDLYTVRDGRIASKDVFGKIIEPDR